MNSSAAECCALKRLLRVRFWDRLSDIVTFPNGRAQAAGEHPPRPCGKHYPALTAAADAPRAANLKPYSGCNF